MTFYLLRDIGNVVDALYGDLPPPIMLIGHSMGGAIAVHTTAANLVPSLLGLCMIDVVEGERYCARYSGGDIKQHMGVSQVFAFLPSPPTSRIVLSLRD